MLLPAITLLKTLLPVITLAKIRCCCLLQPLPRQDVATCHNPSQDKTSLSAITLAKKRCCFPNPRLVPGLATHVHGLRDLAPVSPGPTHDAAGSVSTVAGLPTHGRPRLFTRDSTTRDRYSTFLNVFPIKSAESDLKFRLVCLTISRHFKRRGCSISGHQVHKRTVGDGAVTTSPRVTCLNNKPPATRTALVGVRIYMPLVATGLRDKQPRVTRSLPEPSRPKFHPAKSDGFRTRTCDPRFAAGGKKLPDSSLLLLRDAGF
ncbi:hypothetical protein Bbelb_347010 [Branchiostoma belcheri]|nr:hypothetical protein Bbelb_347010 [Branchiostoma belcheri]